MLKHLKRITYWSLISLGAAFYIYWVSTNWAEPSLGWGDGRVIAESTYQAYAIRSLYISIFIAAIYRELAEQDEKDRIPYNPIVAGALLIAHFAAVYFLVLNW